MPDPLTADQQSLRTSARRGVRWTAVSALLTNLINILQVSIVARILMPADYGLMTMSLVVINLVQAVMEMGVGSALVQKKDPKPSEIGTLLATNVGLGVCGFILIQLLAPVIGWFYKEPALVPLVRLAALNFLILPWGVVYQALLQRRLDFSPIARLEIAGAAGMAATTIVAAKCGLGAYSLIWGATAAAIIRVILLVIAGRSCWKFQFSFRRRELDGYLRFGAYQTAERVVNYLTSNMDYIMVGKFCGPVALGVYRIAYELAVTPLIRLNPVLTRVLFPVFARIQDDNQLLRKAYLKVINVVALVTFPFYLTFIIFAPDVVHVLYGGKWDDSVPLLRLLALIGASKSIANPSGSILLAKGLTNVGFWLNSILCLIGVITFYSSSHFGVRVVALSWIAVETAYWLLAWKCTYSDTIALPLKEFLGVLKKPVFLATSAVLICFLCSQLLIQFNAYLWLRVFIVAATGVLVYGLLLRRFEPNAYGELERLFKRKKSAEQTTTTR